MILIDTHVFLWAASNDTKLLDHHAQMIDAYFERRMVWLSAISTLEIAMLAEAKRIEIAEPIEGWLGKHLSNINLAPLSPEIACESVFLPNGLHKDPFDRIIVATARRLNIPLITYDQKIIEYSKNSHLTCL
jgi:PIN domain nuclease of toxin-antitoxin system